MITSMTIQETDFTGQYLYTTPSDFSPIGPVELRPFGIIRSSSTLAFTINSTVSIICDIPNSTNIPNTDSADGDNGKYIFQVCRWWIL